MVAGLCRAACLPDPRRVGIGVHAWRSGAPSLRGLRHARLTLRGRSGGTNQRGPVRGTAPLAMAVGGRRGGGVVQRRLRRGDPEQTKRRNGCWPRQLDTRVRSIDLRNPKLREGSSYPGWLLGPRRRAEGELVGWWPSATCGPVDLAGRGAGADPRDRVPVEVPGALSGQRARRPDGRVSQPAARWRPLHLGAAAIAASVRPAARFPGSRVRLRTFAVRAPQQTAKGGRVEDAFVPLPVKGDSHASDP
jgi:hypothetical protein